MSARATIAGIALVLGACSATPSPGYRPDVPLRPEAVPLPPGVADVPPVFVSGHSPVYPISRAMKAAQGRAVVEFTVTAEGTTSDFVVVEADYPAYATHAIVAMRDWRFTPAMKDGRVIAVRLRETLRYGAP